MLASPLQLAVTGGCRIPCDGAGRDVGMAGPQASPQAAAECRQVIYGF